MGKLPLSPTAVLGAVKELRPTDEDLRPLLVGGAAERAGELYAALSEGADPEAIRNVSGRTPSAYDLEGANVLVYALAGPTATEEEEEAFRLAARKRVGIVCVLAGTPAGEPPHVRHVLDPDVVPAPSSGPLPTELIAERIADRSGDAAHHLAARVPVLRHAVVQHEIRRFARQNGVLGVAIFIPGADFPVLTLNQIRMVLRIAAAHGEELDKERAFEILSVIAAGFGFRTVARQIVGLVPGFGWAVKGGVAYTATVAVGEAATAYFAAGGTRMIERSVRSWS